MRTLEDDGRPCTQTDEDLWFSSNADDTERAKLLCGRCDFLRTCLEAALTNDEEFGVWGGMSARERRKVIERRRGASKSGGGSVMAA